MAAWNMHRIEINIHEKDLYVNLVIYKDFTEMQRQEKKKREIVSGRSWTYISGIYDHILFENVAHAHAQTTHVRARLNFMQYGPIL